MAEAAAVAGPASVKLIVVDGPAVLSATVGASEARLRRVFDDARAFVAGGLGRMCVVFFDEVDVLCPKRDGVLKRTAVQARVVAQLLTLLDGATGGRREGDGHVVVLAATNHPHSIDPALRRPGRLDKEVRIDPPNPHARLAILKLYCSRLRTDDSAVAHLPALAKQCVGFVGADLAALCREAALAAMPAAVTRAHLQAAFHGIGVPSALRGLTTTATRTSWADIGGYDAVKMKLQQAVEWPLAHPEAFTRLGLQPPRGVLLHGPPGCSKSTLVRACASATGAAFLALSGADVYSPYVGDAEKALRDAFRKARAMPPAIVFLDEVDAMVGKRGIGAAAAAGGGDTSTGVLATLLTEMDGVEWAPGVLVVAATNRLDALDPALLRPGRFELRLEVPLPDAASRLAILRVHTRFMAVGPDVDLGAVAAAADGFSGAQLEAVCREAAMAALRADIAAAAVRQDQLLHAVHVVAGERRVP